MNDAVAEKHDFGAEVGRLLDLVVHSLYSEREIFLRELVANAADAMDRRRFEALTDAGLAPPAEAKIRIVPDKGARTLLIADDGIGMGRQELIDNLGTIARSGTRAFGAALATAKPEERPSLIGQFGVGFYSAFMVADRVEVTSRRRAPRRRSPGRRTARANSPSRRQHVRPPAPSRASREGGCRRVPRPDPPRGGGSQMGRSHHVADHDRPRWQGPAGQRRHRALAQAARRNFRTVV